MKANLLALVATLVLVFGINTGRSANITWTNTNGGNWSGTNNWSPNQVPGPTIIATDMTSINAQRLYRVLLVQ